jgi:toxin ParE1/3/4
VNESRYEIRPKADQDLDEQAYYYALVADSELGHRFLVAAHDTFALLAMQPNMGWQSRHKHAGLEGLRIFRVKDFEKSLILYRPLLDGAEILRVVHASRDLISVLGPDDVD